MPDETPRITDDELVAELVAAFRKMPEHYDWPNDSDDHYYAPSVTTVAQVAAGVIGHCLAALTAQRDAALRLCDDVESGAMQVWSPMQSIRFYAAVRAALAGASPVAVDPPTKEQRIDWRDEEMGG